MLKRKQNLAAASNVKAENAHTKMPNFVKFYKVNQDLTFKVPITISADDRYCDIFPTVNVLKLQTLISFYSQIKFWFSGLAFTKRLLEQQTEKTPIRLLLKKQSDLGLHCLSRACGR